MRTLLSCLCLLVLSVCSAPMCANSQMQCSLEIAEVNAILAAAAAVKAAKSQSAAAGAATMAVTAGAATMAVPAGAAALAEAAVSVKAAQVVAAAGAPAHYSSGSSGSSSISSGTRIGPALSDNFVAHLREMKAVAP